MERSSEEVSDPPSKKPKLANEVDVIFTGASTSAEGSTKNPPISHSAGSEGGCVPPPLFHLTKVRGASHRFNDSNFAVNIKGTLTVPAQIC